MAFLSWDLSAAVKKHGHFLVERLNPSGKAKYTTGDVKYTTAASSPHGPRTDKILAVARGHGLGLSWKLSKPKRASTPGDTCPPPCAMYASTVIPVVYLRLYSPPLLVGRMHLVRAKIEQSWIDMV